MRNNLWHLLGYTTLTLVLTAGAAQSLSGSNTVFTDDIVDGQVYAKDLATNAVSGTKVYDNSLSGADIANNSLKGADIDESTLTLPEGPEGPQGEKGDKGDPGQNGTTLLASLDPPDETFAHPQAGTDLPDDVFASVSFTTDEAGFVTVLGTARYNFNDAGTCSNSEFVNMATTQEIDGRGFGASEAGTSGQLWLEAGEHTLALIQHPWACDGTITPGSWTISEMHTRIYANR